MADEHPTESQESAQMLRRVLIANRGEVARRLIRQYKQMGIETVSVFSEPDVEQPWVEEADYSCYLNGRTVAETYMDARRIVSAAMDAGCDAIHPGYCFLAERLDFAQMALMANLTVIGNDPRALSRAIDRFDVRRVARDANIPTIPASDPLPEGDDGVAAGAQLGFPLYVKTVMGGGVLRRVESLSELPKAVEEVRVAGELLNANRAVYLERAVDKLRRCGTVVVGDRHDTYVHLGTADSSLQYHFRSWVEELGDALVPGLHEKLGQASVEIARGIGWVGVGKVRWAITPDGGWYVLGFSGRLTTGYTLVEQVCGLDLVQTQFRLHENEPLGWSQDDVKLDRHGVQLRIFPVDPEKPDEEVDGHIEKLVIPDGEHVLAEAGTAEGQPCNKDTDPLLVKITVTGPTRHATMVRARAALEQLEVRGVPTNRDFLLRVLAEPAIWKGEYDTHTISQMLAGELPSSATDGAGGSNDES